MEELFSEEQAEQILAIPLTSREFPDMLVWRGDMSGEYSVMWGYRWQVTKPFKTIQTSNDL